MSKEKEIQGFSKMTKTEKIQWIAKNFLYSNPIDVIKEFTGFWHDNIEAQKLLDGFSENTITNFPIPFGIAPNFLINGEMYAVPMVIEESSVVAAASNAAKFWMTRGGFKAKVLSTTKVGQVHFSFDGNKETFTHIFNSEFKQKLLNTVKPITANMEKRGGGVKGIDLIDLSELEMDYFQLRCYFETVDSMGANFINSCLEEFGKTLVELVSADPRFQVEDSSIEVIMCILSNYTPECLVKVEVECPVDNLGSFDDGKMKAREFATRFAKAVRIAQIDPYRASTHNKGIMNGIDAVVIATGNDFRAIESCVHTFAARDGQYRSLSECKIENDIFNFSLTVPLALGTVGGLTSLHPLAKRTLEVLGNPTASRLMEIVASVGLAQNFAAVRSLTTTGIQKGHMKMHLTNILASMQASDEEAILARAYFESKTISVAGVRDFLQSLREKK
jgi:hydroxymethylglutaryl-CoA reductase